MEPIDRNALYEAFPGLRRSHWEVTSPETPTYNCVAWATLDSGRWWWPTPGYYWPAGVPREVSIGAFITAFVTLGFALVDRPESVREDDVVLAIFANDLGPARRLQTGAWTSKLGRSYDITHELEALEGPTYGSVRQFMQRRE